MSLRPILPRDIPGNPFDLIGQRWMLLTAGDDTADYNTMTVSWGGLGVLWSMPVATAYVRPQRHTYQFTEKSEHFTLSVYPEEYRDALRICGSKSGRDIDKAAVCGLTPALSANGGVYFEEAELVIVCKKIYYNDLDPKNFLDERIANCYYPDDYHRMYIGEIVEVLIKD